MNQNIGVKMRGVYEVSVIQNGVIVQHRGPANNLILNAGKDRWFTSTTLSDLFVSCAVGTGTATPAATDTGLQSESARTSSYLLGSPNCGYSVDNSTQKLSVFRTFDFPVESTNKNYTELGWSWSGSPGANLFSRTLISGGTVTVLAGQQLRVKYTIELTVGPIGSQSGSLTIAGWSSTSGNWSLQAWIHGFTIIDGSNGGTAGSAHLEPSSVSQKYCEACSALTLSAIGSGPTFTGVGSSALATLDSYTNGTYTRSWTFPYWSASSWNSTNIEGFCWGASDIYSRYSLAFKFTSPQTKTNTHKLRPPGLTITLS